MGTTYRSKDEKRDGAPAAEPRPIFLRGYAQPLASPEAQSRRRPSEPSNYVIVFDTETQVDAAQRLRIGSYQVREAGFLKEKGFFFDPDTIDPSEQETLHLEAGATGAVVRTVRSFVEEVFFDIGYKADATIVGFNLPFDISRLAIGHASARAVTRTVKSGRTTTDRSMVGGFTFRLSPLETRPLVRVKHLSRRAAFINFAVPRQQPETSGAGSGDDTSASRGFFLDLKTLSAALTSYSFTLDRLAKFLGVGRKNPFKDFGRKIDRQFAQYAAQDAQTAWECYEALITRYDAHRLSPTQPTRIYSEASLGKAYLKAMGVKPWREVQDDFSAETIGRIMSTYYGGRAEVHRRREIVRALYCDFASMYPSVCNLMGLWRFVIAEGVDEQDATAEVRELLGRIDLTQLNRMTTWRDFAVIVQVAPDADIFPVRSRYGADATATIGVNYLSCAEPLWFTLADCVAAKLLTGKAPTVVSAMRFMPRDIQSDLRPVDVAGKPAYRVEPTTQDFYKRVIDLRRIVKRDLARARRQAQTNVEVDRLDAEQLALKILANATSYGVFIELNVEEAGDGAEEISVFGAGEPFLANPPNRELPGTYFHPLLATLITGGARLMLAITEHLLAGAGLDWALCDTDSMAFAMPNGMQPDEFQRRVETVCKWFEALNPYEGDESLLEFEDQNYARVVGDDGKVHIDKSRIEPLFCLAVSAKRYALFNWGPDKDPVVRKASGHGLGHLRAPYVEEVAEDDDEDSDDNGDRESGVPLWQEDVWRAIIRSAMSDRPRALRFDWHDSLRGRAASQHTVTTPALIRGFKSYNDPRDYPEQVRPFGFMLWFHAKKRLERQIENPDAPWDFRAPELKPAAPYAADPADVLDQVFDRGTGEAIAPDELRSYADVLRSYHLHPETKFLGGGSAQSGALRRRHVRADPIIYIGKEADELEEADEYGLTEGEDMATRFEPLDGDWEEYRSAIRAMKVRDLKREARVGHAAVAAVLDYDREPNPRLILKLFAAVQRIRAREAHAADRARDLVERTREWVGEHSLAELAALINYDLENLRKVLRFERPAKPSAGLLDRLEDAFGPQDHN